MPFHCNYPPKSLIHNFVLNHWKALREPLFIIVMISIFSDVYILMAFDFSRESRFQVK